MKGLKFKVKSNTQDVVEKLKSAFKADNGFVFNMGHDKNDSATFKIRKRVPNQIQIVSYNAIIVNGKMLKTATENETDLEISFSQNNLTILYVSVYLFFGLIAIILGIILNAAFYIVGGILLVVGIALWMEVKKKFKRNIQKYKTLIYEVLELKKG